MQKNIKAIIGFDLDGVIIDHTANRLKLAGGMGFNLKMEETASDIMKSIVPLSEYRKIEHILYDDPIVAMSPPLMSGVIKTFKAIRKQGNSFFLISRRRSSEIPINLLRRHALWPDFFCKDNVFFVKEAKDKDSMARQLGISVYLDDQPSVLAELASVPHKFLFDSHRAYNKVNDFNKVYSWAEFLERVKKINK